MSPAESAAKLAEAHSPRRQRPGVSAPLFDARKLTASIGRAARGFRAPRNDNTAYQKSAEWFLDNQYLISRALRQITTEIPHGFRRRLPNVETERRPRVLALAEAFLDGTALDFDEAALLAFVEAYQTRAWLTLAELWALPAMLRISILTRLGDTLDGFFVTGHAPSAGTAANTVLERVIRGLRLLAEIDWRSFVQRCSAVEAILRRDPSNTYEHMEFESRDVYRKVVENLAWETEREEREVAEAATALAAESAGGRERHVGYFLVDRGRRLLKQRIGHRDAGLARLRAGLSQHPTLAYLGAVGGGTTLLLALLALTVQALPTSTRVLICALFVVPAVSIAVALTNWCVNRLLVPQLLPKIDFSAGIPEDCRTLVVVPALVARPEDFDSLLAQLELHYLSCPDPAVTFALLSDHVDSPTKPDDRELLLHAGRLIDALNARHPRGATGPFHLMHRESRWNAGEGCFMGWERKRGKLEELNRYLRGDTATSYEAILGDPAGLENIRFVITLDADTQLPRGAARRLIGLMAHPLNTAAFDARTGRVPAGYTVAQPRVDASPAYGATSLFGQLSSGDTALDIYTHASSDVYQDLFGAGTYVGKGIYEVDSFARSLADRVPVGSLASHDLFEGAHGRAALVSDIVLFEQYPQSYLAFAHRGHRWIRGDWQLLPWLLPRVPTARGAYEHNRLSLMDRWRIADNLRRSLLAPSTVGLFLVLVGLLPEAGAPLVLLPLLVPLAISAPALLDGGRALTLKRWALSVALLPHEAWVALDAVVRTLVRLTITRRRLLEWVTAADAARAYAAGSHAQFWREMGPSVALLTLLATALGYRHPWAIVGASPALVAWLLSPEIARWASASAHVVPSLDTADRTVLRHLARRTWLFFETFVRPADQWLAPDNFQQEPGGVVAHRTSPTNIGLALVADVSAYDLGYIGRTELAALVRHTHETLARLERYHGHWLNWYDTRTLEPLLPRYVSTVDSGNLLAALITAAKGCRDAASAPSLRPVRFLGLGDTLDLFEAALGRVAVPHAAASATVDLIRTALGRGADAGGDGGAIATELSSSHLPALEKDLLAVLEQTTSDDGVAVFRELQTWLERLKHQTRSLHADSKADPLDAARTDLLAVAEALDAERAAIDFTFLYDGARKLFHIGYNVTSDRLDAHHYDLLASEARLASYLAIVENQVAPEHWFTLGRPITRIDGKASLVSWGGTMFEYLMPPIFMRSQPDTLLQQSAELAVRAQIEHGVANHVPWGVSESGFAQVDAQQNYQYRSFGVPALGLRRGLEDDCVVAPYACVLALPFAPRAVLDNLVALEHCGAMGLYGLFEAVDYDEARALEASLSTGEPIRKHAVVQSHMAHHQGMILATLNNVLNDDVLVERFHSDARVRTGEALLSERLPSIRVAEELAHPTKPATEPASLTPTFPGWVPEVDSAQVALVGNGRLTATITDAGAGSLSWNGVSVTRAPLDATCDANGTWIYLRDEADGQTWSATPAPMRPRTGSDEVLFDAYKAEFHHRDRGVSVRTEISVAPEDDVEVRRVTLHNEGTERRVLRLATYAEPVLEPASAAERQPAFSRMFVKVEALPEQHGAVASRRLRNPDDPSVMVGQMLVWDDEAVSWVGLETDRRAFVGRRRDARSAACNIGGETVDDGASLDPAMALAVRIELAPHARVEVALVTAAAKGRDGVLDLLRRFGSLHTVRWVAQDARRELGRRLDREGMTSALFPDAMRLVSRLLLPATHLRAARPDIDGALVAKSGLWGRGISGDDPILVVRIRKIAADSLVEEVLAAYRYLRMCSRKVEVVFIDEGATGYQSEEAGSVRARVIAAGASGWINQRGGIFVLPADQLSADDRQRIFQAARVLLDSEAGSLHDQLTRPPAAAPPLPGFLATRPADGSDGPRVEVPPLTFETAFGGFARDGREYVVKVVSGRAPPAPWCNVLANADLGCLVSESSLGATWAGNSGENRLTPWRNDPVSDVPSEALYLRDEETAQVWSTTPLPAGQDVDTVVRHGAGYTVFERESHGLRQTLTVFVPADAPVKVLQLSITNRLPRARRLTATYYAEWVLGAAREEHTTHVVCEADLAAQTLFARCGWNADFAERVAFVCADRPMHGYTFDRGEFLGRSGSLARPEALGRWGLSGAKGNGLDPCAALQTHIDLAEGASVELHFVLGQGLDLAQARALASRFRAPAEVAGALTRMHAFWDKVLGAVQVKTPEPAMDLLLNQWLLYQSLSSRLFARTAYYQSSGAYGYRDQLQDVMALMHGDPAYARAHILTSAAHQFDAGDVLHWWHPPADRGVRTRCSDDLAWLPFVTAHYVEATGDTGILDEEAPFLDAPPLAPDEHDRYSQFSHKTSGTITDHCRRALQRALTEGEHGLPLMGEGDWNDGMNRVGKQGRGESVWLGFFLCTTMNAFARLRERQGDPTEATTWREKAAALGRRLDESAWDGAWYLRAFYDDGTPLGGAQSRACRIDSIAQSWAVLSESVDPARAAQALRSADSLLVRERERLVLVLDPPFKDGRRNPGYIQAYPPGIRENGGQYTHAATWLGFAYARERDGRGAERIFRMLNPILHAPTDADAELYRVEPYVLAGDVYGAAPFTGRGGWTWYTGGAAWLWRLGVEEVLGLRRVDGGLQVDPCIPAHWPGFEATIRLGDEECHVVVSNTNGVGHGVASATLDGAVIASPIVRPRGDGARRRELRIVLGSAAKAAE